MAAVAPWSAFGPGPMQSGSFTSAGLSGQYPGQYSIGQYPAGLNAAAAAPGQYPAGPNEANAACDATLPMDQAAWNSHGHSQKVPECSFQQLWPTPQTSTYGVYQKWRPPLMEMPSQAVQCEGWGQINLQNKVDYSEQSFADKYMQGPSEARTYYMKTDGWALCFWDPKLWDPRAAERGHLVPAGWLDLRSIMEADARIVGMSGFRSTFQFEVVAHTKTGRFLIQVQTQIDAAMWVRCMQAALVESRTLQMRHQKEALDAAELDHAHAEQGHAGKVFRVEAPIQRGGSSRSGSVCSDPYIAIAPERAKILKDLWSRCLRAAIHGAPPRSVFHELFRLYDDSGDHMLQVQEMETLLRELLHVRRETLRQAQEEQLQGGDVTASKADVQDLAELGKLAKELNTHYDFLRKEGHRARAVLLNSSLDTSHDGFVMEGEFVRGAPELVLPGKELWMEAKFYQRAGARLARKAKQRGEEDDSEDEGGCVQH